MNVAICALGLMLVAGAWRRWSWLVEPPQWLWPLYSQATLRRLFGTQAVVAFTYCLGASFLALGLFWLARVLADPSLVSSSN
jgi:hypothetical protein